MQHLVSVLVTSSKIPDGDAKQDRSPNPSEPHVESSNETGNEVADGDGDANQKGSSNLSEPNVESSKMVKMHPIQNQVIFRMKMINLMR
jgi:hypothetical protein